MSRPKRRATYDDLMQVPDHLIGELIDGELITSPRPASPHARAAWAIGQDLGRFDGTPEGSGRPGGWWILFEPELHLGGDVLVPDLAAWRHERMSVIPNVAAFTVAPDWVCEVVSPGTERVDRTKKLGVYARASVAHAWIVDPLRRTLENYRLDGERWVLVGAHGATEASIAAEPFGSLVIDLGRWWLVDPTQVTV